MAIEHQHYVIEKMNLRDVNDSWAVKFMDRVDDGHVITLHSIYPSMEAAYNTAKDLNDILDEMEESLKNSAVDTSEVLSYEGTVGVPASPTAEGISEDL